MSHATSAAVSATLSSATTNTLLNNGNVGRGLSDTFDKDSRKNIAVAAVGSGLSGGFSDTVVISIDSETLRPVAENNLRQRVGYTAINTASKTAAQVGIGGAEVGKSLVDNLRSNIADQGQSVAASAIGKNYLEGNINYAEHKAAHAVTGGTAALVSGGNIVSGALGAMTSEALGEKIFEDGKVELAQKLLDREITPYEFQKNLESLKDTAIKVSKVGGASGGLITGDVGSAFNSAEIAADNNLASVLDAAVIGYDLVELYDAYYSDDSERLERAVVDLGVDIIPAVPAGLTKFARQATKTTTKKTKADIMKQNRVQGKGFEVDVFKRERNSTTDRELAVKTKDGTRVRIDIAKKEPKGICKLLECKSSSTAPLTKNQKKAFPEIKKSGATVVSKNKKHFPYGSKIEPTEVEIVRPNNINKLKQ